MGPSPYLLALGGDLDAHDNCTEPDPNPTRFTRFPHPSANPRAPRESRQSPRSIPITAVRVRPQNQPHRPRKALPPELPFPVNTGQCKPPPAPVRTDVTRCDCAISFTMTKASLTCSFFPKRKTYNQHCIEANSPCCQSPIRHDIALRKITRQMPFPRTHFSKCSNNILIIN